MKCTAKEKKEGYGGKMTKVFVAIAHGHGAVLCEQYEKQLTGQLQRTFWKHLNIAVNHEENYSWRMGKLRIPWKQRMLRSILVLDFFWFHSEVQALTQLKTIQLHSIWWKKLNRNALEQNRTQESYHQFSERAKETILNFPVAFLDNNWICG